MTPISVWQAHVDSGRFSYDAVQEQAVTGLNAIYDEFCLRYADPTPVFSWRRLVGRRQKHAPIKGLYMWGGVGRGKTWLMDLFYDALPGSRKEREHFHRFMRSVHHLMKENEHEHDPLKHVAEGIASRVDIICFDEFFVTDITDAMILGRLFELLFSRGVTLVATSNIEPDGLYKNGLQRSRFLPAIEMIKQHCDIMNVDSGTDYRLRTLKQAKLYYSPHDEAAINAVFNELMPTEAGLRVEPVLNVSGRPLQARRVQADLAWFDFRSLCDGPRSQHDYIELANRYQTVIVTEVPQLTSQIEDQARRFVYLIDEFYDSHVKLVLSCEVPMLDLYVGEQMQFEFQRTMSRLLEMQSEEYLASAHKRSGAN